MAHEFVNQMIDEETQQARVQIMLTLVGGTLLITSAFALFIFDQSFYSDLLAMMAALLLGVPLVVSAAKDLIKGHTHMDELVALGVIAAFANAQYIEAGTIAFFMIITSLVEHRTALGARKSIESLVQLTPTRAFRLDESGEEVEVEAKDLKPGDVVRVRPGDNIPGDGVVLNGMSTVNQANITGESLPVDKLAGDDVFGGTINMTGAMEIEITKAGQDTTLGRVQDLILQAESSRVPISRVIDRYAGWYTPTILMLAGIVLFFTREMDAAISMLIIACPCAIILSTPTAMVGALSSAARLGVLVKNVTDLEVARNLSAIVFDKTGTLTTGNLAVTRLNPLEGVAGAELLETAAAAEQNSKHPVAQAVVQVAKKAQLSLEEVTDFEESSGKGVIGKINGEQVLVGRNTWMEDHGIDLSAIDVSDAEGLSLLYVARGGKLLGWVGLEDQTRPGAAMAMDDLREAGIKQLVMVTGDRWSVAKRVAAEMHCTDVRAEVLPAEKLEIVDELKSRGHIVAVIGDGVNDAPALAAGNISIAMGAAGSDVAIHSASIALMNNNLNRIPFLVKLSRKAFAIVRQNLVFALVYVATFETLAAFQLVPPMLAAALHAASSFVVVFNSARLVRSGEEIEFQESQAASVRGMSASTSAPPSASRGQGGGFVAAT